MTKPTASQIARFKAIESRKKAANDDAPAPAAKRTGTLKIDDIIGSVEIFDVKIADDSRGNPYYVFKGSRIVTTDGKEIIRTVMAFESYDLVRETILAEKTLVATLANTGSTMKIVGIEVDGVMTMIDRSIAAAA